MGAANGRCCCCCCCCAGLGGVTAATGFGPPPLPAATTPPTTAPAAAIARPGFAIAMFTPAFNSGCGTDAKGSDIVANGSFEATAATAEGGKPPPERCCGAALPYGRFC